MTLHAAYLYRLNPTPGLLIPLTLPELMPRAHVIPISLSQLLD